MLSRFIATALDQEEKNTLHDRSKNCSVIN